MHWEDEAIILSARKFNERDTIATVFAREQGVFSGVVRAGQSKTKTPIYQPMNIVSATWRARLDEQLGTMTAELTEAISARVIDDRLKLQASLSIAALIKTSIGERDPHPNLYATVHALILHMVGEDDWLEEYVKFEVELLHKCGFGFDFSKCAATGTTEDLQYISPKTGRAVSAAGAVGYEDKLFKIPEYDDYKAWLKITEFFLERNVYYPHHRKIPQERSELLKSIDKACSS